MAFHAEAAGDGPAALRYASAAARRAAALASHREAAAQFERALRFTRIGADPLPVAGLHDGLAYEASLLDRWQEAADARERALALWRDVGDRLREGDTHPLAVLLAVLAEPRRRGDIAAARAAIALLEPLGPTVELAWAYASLAAMWMVRSASQDAIGAGPAGAGGRRAARPARSAQRRAEHRGVCRP